MAISVDWGTKVINVPKADTTLIQASPEVRELDVDTFRLALKALEADFEGMPYPDTHRHIQEFIISGITYARGVEIINGYTVEFENGQYAVSLIGGNNNIADVKVANEVSLIVNNSAGLANPDIAGSVWDASRASHTTSGTFGDYVGRKLLSITKFLGLK